MPPLALPISGKVYETYGPSVRDKDRATELSDARSTRAWTEAEVDEFDRIMWPNGVYDQMVADGVSRAALSRAVSAAWGYWQYGPDFAEVVWNTGGDRAAVAKWFAAQAQHETLAKTTA